MGFFEQLLPPASKDAFAHKVMREMKKRKVKGPFTYDREHFMLKAGEGNSLFLTNAYDEYCAVPIGKRAKVIRQYAVLGAGGANTIPGSFAGAKAKLLPRVRERFYGESMAFTFQMKGLPRLDLPAVKLNDDLVVNLIYDAPESVSMIDVTTLAKWGVGFEEAMGVARENLWKISNENFVELLPGMFAGSWTDSHGATRMYLHDLIWQLPVRGKHVVMVPNRDLLLVTGEENEAGLLKMAEMGKEATTRPRFMLGTAFRLNEKTWERFLPARSSKAYVAMRSLHSLSMGRMYAEQKHFIEARDKNAKAVNPPFAATFSGVNGADGLLKTYAMWADGVETLLPETDFFALGAMREGERKILGFVERGEALREFADLLQSTGDYPRRWLTKGFPSEEQLARVTLSEEPPEPRE